MSDKTFSETQGIAPFDWRHALTHPELHNYENLAHRSAGWVTCACGNQCAIIPRYSSTCSDGVEGMPMDDLLRSLGGQFYTHVAREGWDHAEAVLDEIESRSAIVIAEELAKLNAEPLHA